MDFGIFTMAPTRVLVHARHHAQREIRQIWKNVSDKSKKILELCYILGTHWN
jgi:hypothetical protein